MIGNSRNAWERKARISVLFVRARAKLHLVLMLLMFNGISISGSAQRTIDARASNLQQPDDTQMSQSSSKDSSQDEYTDLKFSSPVRQLAQSAGLSLKTTYHLCVDCNFLLMMALILWKGAPFLKEALQTRSRSIRREIDEARRLADDAAKGLAEVEKRWAKLDSDIAEMQAFANSALNQEEQLWSLETAEAIHRIVEYSQFEIERVEQRVRHELKAFAAGLAVSVARESIQIDERTDESLVEGIIEGLGRPQFAQTAAGSPAQGVGNL